MVYGNTKGIKQTVLARLDALIGAYDKNLLIDRTVLSTIAEITEKSTARFACSSQETDRSSRWEWATAARYRLKIFVEAQRQTVSGREMRAYSPERKRETVGYGHVRAHVDAP